MLKALCGLARVRALSMQSFAIESILFDEEQHVLEIGIVMSKPIAEGAAPNGGPATPVGNSGVTEGRHRWADR